MWTCSGEEKMTLKEVDGQRVEEIKTKIIAKDGTITRVPGKFQGYETSEEEPVEQPRRHDLYGFVDHPQLQQGNPMNEFAPHRLTSAKVGNRNMNGWLVEDKENVGAWRGLKWTQTWSPRSSKTCVGKRQSSWIYGPLPSRYFPFGVLRLPIWFPKEYDRVNRRYAASLLLEQSFGLVEIHISPSNEGRVATNGMAWTHFKALLVEEFLPRLAPEIRGMLRATQPTSILEWHYYGLEY
ncbi:hypothetical protein Tco_1122318 [Tanacetum coccineum]|uniref:Uncharacterized protein n=1 Tax=Tanacetum coccineum TaxID=301880 RepID=A0ABQ5J073_9ASTR